MRLHPSTRTTKASLGEVVAAVYQVFGNSRDAWKFLKTLTKAGLLKFDAVDVKWSDR